MKFHRSDNSVTTLVKTLLLLKTFVKLCAFWNERNQTGTHRTKLALNIKDIQPELPKNSSHLFQTYLFALLKLQ